MDRCGLERGSDPFKENCKQAPRNDRWYHLNNSDIISMPDKWEYPWYAAWDLAFHVMALTLVDTARQKRPRPTCMLPDL
jgi:hypothetical protein